MRKVNGNFKGTRGGGVNQVEWLWPQFLIIMKPVNISIVKLYHGVVSVQCESI